MTFDDFRASRRFYPDLVKAPGSIAYGIEEMYEGMAGFEYSKGEGCFLHAIIDPAKDGTVWFECELAGRYVSLDAAERALFDFEG